MTDSDHRADKRHPMKVVVRRTGLTAHVIRVWERRYGAVEPARTQTNRRLYSDADIERLQLLHQATRQGHQIGRLADLPVEELTELAGLPPWPTPPTAAESADAPSAVDPSLCVSRGLDAIRELDAASLDEELARASVSMSRKKLLEEVISPLMHQTGERWADGSLRVAHEHLASSVIRNFLGSMRDAGLVPATAPSILFTTPAGQLHEIGALLAATVAAAEGWRVIYLGPNLPAEEIAGAALQERSRAIALSIVYPAGDPHVDAELVKLRRAVGPRLPILVGGRGAASYGDTLERIAAIRIASLAELPVQLDELHASPSAL